MTPEQFCYWLQGRAELQPGNPPSAEEWQMIRDHLATVFHKVTPPLQVDPLRNIHDWAAPWMPGDPIPPYRIECSSRSNGVQGGQAIATC